jgi:hypothetical protein
MRRRGWSLSATAAGVCSERAQRGRQWRGRRTASKSIAAASGGRLRLRRCLLPASPSSPPPKTCAPLQARPQGEETLHGEKSRVPAVHVILLTAAVSAGHRQPSCPTACPICGRFWGCCVPGEGVWSTPAAH